MIKAVEHKDFSKIHSLELENIQNLIEKGQKFYDFQGYLCQIVTSFEDGKDELFVVYKSWVKHKKRWVYEVQNLFIFMHALMLLGELFVDSGGNYLIRKKRR